MENQDQNQQLNALNSQLAALQAQMQAQMQATGVTVSAAPNAWAKPVTVPAMIEALGVSVPISLETPAGKIRLYLNFPGSAASSPQALMALIEALTREGVPLDVWQQKSGGNGSWGGGGNRGGYNSNRGWGR